MSSMKLSDAIDAGCKLIGPAKRDWWFDNDGEIMLAANVAANKVATGADVMGTAVVGRAGSVVKAQHLVIVKYATNLTDLFFRAWPFLAFEVPPEKQWCPTKGSCFPRPSNEWNWWQELQHMHDRHKVTREAIATYLRAAGF